MKSNYLRVTNEEFQILVKGLLFGYRKELSNIKKSDDSLIEEKRTNQAFGVHIVVVGTSEESAQNYVKSKLGASIIPTTVLCIGTDSGLSSVRGKTYDGYIAFLPELDMVKKSSIDQLVPVLQAIETGAYQRRINYIFNDNVANLIFDAWVDYKALDENIKIYEDKEIFIDKHLKVSGELRYDFATLAKHLSSNETGISFPENLTNIYFDSTLQNFEDNFLSTIYAQIKDLNPEAVFHIHRKTAKKIILVPEFK